MKTLNHCIVFFFVFMALSVEASEVGEPYISFAGIKLDESTKFADIEKMFGPAPLNESGEAGEYEASVCYTTGKGQIGFLSGEMGGADHGLLGFFIAEGRSDIICAVAPKTLESLELKIGDLFLGMTKQQFSEQLESVEWKDNVGQRFFEGKEALTDEELSRLSKQWPDIVKRPNFDSTVSVIGTFNGNRLVEYRVWRIRTL